MAEGFAWGLALGMLVGAIAWSALFALMARAWNKESEAARERVGPIWKFAERQLREGRQVRVTVGRNDAEEDPDGD